MLTRPRRREHHEPVRHDPDRDVWAPLSVTETASLLSGCPARWWLSGGWAIDHWLGATTRPHGDIDVSTLRPGVRDVLGALPAHLEPFAAVAGHLLPFADRADDPGVRNVWVRDRTAGRWVLQVNVEEGDRTSWRYRRDPRVHVPWAAAVRPVAAVPTGSLATQLLWKSRDPRPRDDADLAAALPALPEPERQWLAHAIRTAHPSSPWLSTVASSG